EIDFAFRPVALCALAPGVWSIYFLHPEYRQRFLGKRKTDSCRSQSHGAVPETPGAQGSVQVFAGSLQRRIGTPNLTPVLVEQTLYLDASLMSKIDFTSRCSSSRRQIRHDFPPSIKRTNNARH